MNIGDLFFSGHLDNAPLKVDAQKAGEAAGQTFAGSFNAHLKSSSLLAGGLLLGIGQQLARTGIDALTGALGGAIQSAIEDEKSISLLTAALKANVPAWDGDRVAIEKRILASQRLAFTDEDMRASLGRLVAATHDVAEAEAIQNTAMDLARFKGISLMEATEALTRVEAGSYRILKSLGIVLKDGATQTEALAAVQRVAAGQAEAYANTNAGKLEASQIKVNEAMEHFGTTILPGVTAVMVTAADATAGLAGGIGEVIGGLQGLFTWSQTTAAATQDAADKLDRSERSVRAVGVAFDDTGDKATNMSRAIQAAGVTSAVAIENMRKRIVAAATGVVDGAYNTIIAADNLSGVNAEIAAQRRIIAAGGAAAATDRSTSAIDRQVKALDRASDAERKHTDAQLAAIDVQISQLDLAERQLAIEEQRHSLNEQLNAAERELLVAQGAGDAEGVSTALAKIADLKAQQVENERKLGVEATRNALEAQKAEIEGKSRARQTELSDLKSKLREQEQAVSASTGATVADARVKLHELYKTQADLVLTLALAGKGGSKAVADALVDMHNRLATAVGEERTAILKTIQALKDLQAQANRTLFTVPGVGSFARPAGARGGPTEFDSGPSGKLGAGQQVIVRLEIGGKPLLDYIDEHLNWRRNT